MEPEGTPWRPTLMTRLMWVAAAVVCAGLTAACGEAAVTGAGASSNQRYTATTTVLENPDHGPQLCAGGVADSLPPQCAGADIVGWDWTAVAHESNSGTRWGDYRVVGTWDGTTLTLTEVATAAERHTGAPAADHIDFSAPCPEPAGGWAPVDDALTSTAALDRASEVAQRLEGYAGLWIDQQIPDEASEETANDPARLVLVVATSVDVAATEAAIREVWGGSLCVTQVARTEAELLGVQEAVFAEVPGVLSAGIDVVANQVEVGVLVATADLQQQLDDEYGVGAVRLRGALQPIDG